MAVVLLYRIRENAANMTQREYSIGEFYRSIQNNEVEKVRVTKVMDVSDAGRAEVHLRTGNQPYTLNFIGLSNHDRLLTELSKEHDFLYITMPIPSQNLFFQFILPLLTIGVIAFFFLFILQQMQGGAGGSKAMNFGKNRARLIVDDKKRVTFKNVAGIEEEKKELEEIVEFLKFPKKFIEIGARIPKGVLLVGPPGTGKTLLARAVAGEAGVPFFTISGSDFVEMYVGVGASRVRDLFEQAKKNMPCIVFIDEIDAVGRRRGSGHGGGHDEREQTLNQLLVEMDGFGVNDGIIILAATNRVDILDPALLRPGRFDRSVMVGLPDVKGREDILNIHAKGKIFDEDEVDLRVVALTTSGFTGADLENLLNEAALLAAREDKKAIQMEDIRKAFVKIGIGTEKKSRVVSDKEKRITAYHEAGHGIVQEVLSELDHVHIISIIPTGRAGGYTMFIPDEDRSYYSKRRMEQELVSLLSGRAAEEIIIKDVTTGASSDIQRATSIARNMVTKYGMSEKLGPIQFGDDRQEMFVGNMSPDRNYGEEVASTIDNEIKRIVETAYEEALIILKKYIEVLHKTAELLVQKEKITGKEFRELFPEGVTREISFKGMDFSGTVEATE